MSVLLAKLLLDDLYVEVHSLRMTKFAVLDMIGICVKLSNILSDALAAITSSIRIRVRELLMHNIDTLTLFKAQFRALHDRLVVVKDKIAYVKRWIDHHEHFGCY